MNSRNKGSNSDLHSQNKRPFNSKLHFKNTNSRYTKTLILKERIQIQTFNFDAKVHKFRPLFWKKKLINLKLHFRNKSSQKKSFKHIQSFIPLKRKVQFIFKP
jgi:hypothetical protein